MALPHLLSQKKQPVKKLVFGLYKDVKAKEFGESKSKIENRYFIYFDIKNDFKSSFLILDLKTHS